MEAPSTNNHFGGAMPSKVQVYFDFPLFEGHIDTNSLEKWLTLLEGYFSVQNFPNSEKIIFSLLKAFPTLEIGGSLTLSNMSKMNL
jgi:hypothetical protein